MREITPSRSEGHLRSASLSNYDVDWPEFVDAARHACVVSGVCARSKHCYGFVVGKRRRNRRRRRRMGHGQSLVS